MVPLIFGLALLAAQPSPAVTADPIAAAEKAAWDAELSKQWPDVNWVELSADTCLPYACAAYTVDTGPSGRWDGGDVVTTRVAFRCPHQAVVLDHPRSDVGREKPPRCNADGMFDLQALDGMSAPSVEKK